MGTSRLELTRPQILAFRRRTGALDQRLPPGKHSLRKAAWAGLQDSMPRAALLSLHARVDGIDQTSWDDPSLVQLWGPRFNVFVVAEADIPVFSLGRLPDDEDGRQVAQDLAAQLDAHLDGRSMRDGEAAKALGVHHNRLRYAAPTGRVLIRWGGARAPTIRTVPSPEVDPREARLELARRFLRVFGPATDGGFAKWAGIKPREAEAAFAALGTSLTPVRTPIGEAWILARDEADFRAAPVPAAPARLLPSGDAYYLCWGADRSLLVADAECRAALWTSRVWPGAILVDGEIVGTWRRAQHKLTIDIWRRLSRGRRDAIEAEAASLPLPDLDRKIVVRWSD